mmetsp:Transcript_22260/g.44166  ORF Transcript_22260/g.44166 Transcript_22260/m.44166 type:complete len:214 (-) Transcript_22260:1128-1769(-)
MMRLTTTGSWSPQCEPCRKVWKSSILRTGWLCTSRITSPLRSPDSQAGLFGATEDSNTPCRGALLLAEDKLLSLAPIFGTIVFISLTAWLLVKLPLRANCWLKRTPACCNTSSCSCSSSSSRALFFNSASTSAVTLSALPNDRPRGNRCAKGSEPLNSICSNMYRSISCCSSSASCCCCCWASSCCCEARAILWRVRAMYSFTSLGASCSSLS